MHRHFNISLTQSSRALFVSCGVFLFLYIYIFTNLHIIHLLTNHSLFWYQIYSAPRQHHDKSYNSIHSSQIMCVFFRVYSIPIYISFEFTFFSRTCIIRSIFPGPRFPKLVFCCKRVELFLL